MKDMNRLFKVFAAAAVIVMGAACQQEIIPDGTNGDVAVNLSVSVPDVVTKAIADGTNVDILYYEVYNADMSKRLVKGSTPRTSEKNFELNLTLVQDQTYNFLFWAQVSTGNYYTVTDLRNVTVNYGSVVDGNDEARNSSLKFLECCLSQVSLTYRHCRLHNKECPRWCHQR